MGQTFIRVGNSRALTIPAKSIRQSGFDDSTVFEFQQKGSAFIFRARPIWPKIRLSGHLSDRMRHLIDNQVRYTEEEIAEDPRLQAILEK